MWPERISTGVSLSHSHGSGSGELGSEPQLDSSPEARRPWPLPEWNLNSAEKQACALWEICEGFSYCCLFPVVSVSQLDKKGFSGLLVFQACDLVLWELASESEFLM